MRRAPLLALVFAACGSGPIAGDAGLDSGLMDAGMDAAPIRMPDAGMDAGPLCTPTDAGLPDPLVCNGHAELCARSYADVSFPMAHNAMSNADDGWMLPDQNWNLRHQLEHGIRGFMLDTWMSGDQVLLCHGLCGLGSRPFIDALRDLKLFMDCHPAEVLTLIIEAHIDQATTEAAFTQAELLPYLHQQPPGDPDWPTLSEMIQSGQRMVVFTEDSSATLPWYQYAYGSYMWDTNYAARMPSDFSCDVGRGSRANRLFLLNHFLTMITALPRLAEMVNHNPLLLDRAQQCQSESGFLPNFVALDFVDIGDLLATVDTLNGL